MDEEITIEIILKMGIDARREVSHFAKDTFEILLKKYESIQDNESFLEESIKKLLREQTKETNHLIAERETQLQLMKMADFILGKQNKSD